MYYDIYTYIQTDRQTDRHRTLLGTAPCTSKSSYSNTSWYTFHLTFFFLWYFLILVPFQLAKKNMDLASLKNELSQSEARLTEQVCTLFSTSFSIFSCSHFAFLCLAQLVEMIIAAKASIYSRDQEGRSTSFTLHLRTFMLELVTWSIAISCLYCVAKDHSFCLFEFPVLTEWKERGGNESVWKNQQSSIPAGGSTEYHQSVNGAKRW